jgi:(p)ppGpp synthase/HD superfamily hydrolase
MTFSDKRLDEAYQFAKKAHGDDTDRYGNHLFTAHVVKVFENAGGESAPTIVGVTALLHDVLEKTSVEAPEITKIFGEKVSEAVVDLSRDPETPYFDYIRDLSSNPIAVTVKRADLSVNLDSAQKKRLPKDKERIKKYLKALQLLKSSRPITPFNHPMH